MKCFICHGKSIEKKNVREERFVGKKRKGKEWIGTILS
jgi:hypothetical protein